MPKSAARSADEIRANAAKYKSRSEFASADCANYMAARKLGILDDVCFHMQAKLKTWTLDALSAEALKYPTKSAFERGCPSAYNSARTRGLLDQICTHMLSLRTQWTLDALTQAASSFSTRVSFEHGNKAAYRAARRRGVMDAICAHMTALRTEWDDESIALDAAIYATRAEFRRFSPNAYSAALKRGIMNEVCSHMGRRLRSQEDVIYILVDGDFAIADRCLVKFGITSSRLGNQRTDTHLEGHFRNGRVLLSRRTHLARKIETKLLREFASRPQIQSGRDGASELRMLAQGEVLRAKDMVERMAA